MVGKFNRVVLSMLALAGAFSLAFVGTGSASAQSMSSDAHVRVLHASPDAPAVDVYVNGAKAFSNLAFKDISQWAALPAGSYDVKVTAAGKTDAVIAAKLPLEGGKYYTVAAVGKLANIAPKVIEDNLTAAPGKASLRVVHASPDAPAVDVAAKGGAVLVPNLTFPNASDYLSVDPMTVDVEVRPAGTQTVALAVPGLTLEAGKVYTVYAIGLLSGTPALGVLPVVDASISAPEMSGGAIGDTTAAGMPATGAGDNTLGLAAGALLLLALVTTTTGMLVRVRNR
jgi:hypothetical protein